MELNDLEVELFTDEVKIESLQHDIEKASMDLEILMQRYGGIRENLDRSIKKKEALINTFNSNKDLDKKYNDFIIFLADIYRNNKLPVSNAIDNQFREDLYNYFNNPYTLEDIIRKDKNKVLCSYALYTGASLDANKLIKELYELIEYKKSQTLIKRTGSYMIEVRNYGVSRINSKAPICFTAKDLLIDKKDLDLKVYAVSFNGSMVTDLLFASEEGSGYLFYPNYKCKDYSNYNIKADSMSAAQLFNAIFLGIFASQFSLAYDSFFNKETQGVVFKDSSYEVKQKNYFPQLGMKDDKCIYVDKNITFEEAYKLLLNFADNMSYNIESRNEMLNGITLYSCDEV
jgi:hypothetical protein